MQSACPMCEDIDNQLDKNAMRAETVTHEQDLEKPGSITLKMETQRLNKKFLNLLRLC